MHKDVKALQRKLKKQGWEFEMSKHLKAYPPDYEDNHDYVSIPLTPSCSRALNNTKKYLKKRGYKE